MADTSFTQSDFTGGELSPFVEGRIDAAGYHNGVYIGKNCLSLPQGPLVRRPGSKHIHFTKFGDKPANLVPFEPVTDAPYMIEFGHGYCRFLEPPRYLKKLPSLIMSKVVDISAITTGTSTTVDTSQAHGLSSGDRLYLDGVRGDRSTSGVALETLNGREYRASVSDTDTVVLKNLDGSNVSSSALNDYLSGGQVYHIYEIASEYQGSEVKQIRYAQSVDVMYLTHQNHIPRTLSRVTSSTFSFADMDLLDGPYLDINATTTTLTPSGTTSSITLTASAATGINGGSGFLATDVGRLLRLRGDDNNWTWGEITAIASTTSVTFNIRGNDLPNTTATTSWRLGVYSATTGYPSCVIFFEDRLVLAGCPGSPTRIDMSGSGTYDIFSPTDPDGTVNDGHAVGAVINSRGNNKILWVSSDDYGILVGTSKEEWLVRSADPNGNITPTSITARRVRTSGSAEVDAVDVDGEVLYVQKAKRKVRSLSGNGSKYEAEDISIIAEHLTLTGIEELAYQRNPFATVWMRRGDGLAVSATPIPGSDTASAGWYWHELGDEAPDTSLDYGKGNLTPKVVQNQVKSVAVLMDDTGTREETWFLVRRIINGEVKQSIEVLGRVMSSEQLDEEAYYLDNGHQITVDSNGVDFLYVQEINGEYYVREVYGLWHLEGKTIRFFYAGGALMTKTVEGGMVSFGMTGTDVFRLVDYTTQNRPHILSYGLEYTSHAVMMRPEAGASDGGPALGKLRSVPAVALNFYRTRNISVGNYEINTYDDVVFQTSTSDLTDLKGIDTSEANVVVTDYDTHAKVDFTNTGLSSGDGTEFYLDADNGFLYRVDTAGTYDTTVSRYSVEDLDIVDTLTDPPVDMQDVLGDPTTSDKWWFHGVVPGLGYLIWSWIGSNSGPILIMDPVTDTCFNFGSLQESNSATNSTSKFARMNYATGVRTSGENEDPAYFVVGKSYDDEALNILRATSGSLTYVYGATSFLSTYSEEVSETCIGNWFVNDAGHDALDVWVLGGSGGVYRVEMDTTTTSANPPKISQPITISSGVAELVIPDDYDGTILVVIDDTTDRIEKWTREGTRLWTLNVASISSTPGGTGKFHNSFRAPGLLQSRASGGYFSMFRTSDDALLTFDTINGALLETVSSTYSLDDIQWITDQASGKVFIRSGDTISFVTVGRGILSEVEFRNYYNASLETSLYKMDIPSDRNRDGQVAWKSSGPYPWCVLSVTAWISTTDEP